MPVMTRIYYFSDDAASEHRNYKNFSNLLMHFEDFGVYATGKWHFFEKKIPVMVLVGQ